MLFNSYLFMLVFLPATLGGYTLCGRFGRRAATGWLVLCSIVFYGWWNVGYLALILGSTLVNYRLGKALAETRSRAVLILGLTFNLGVLGWFKYAGLFSHTLASLTGLDGFVVTVALPLGISFFTFQKIAYLVDCWRGETKPYDMLEFSLFVLFFPQLIAGPIIHHADIMPQFSRPQVFRINADNMAQGLMLLAIGLFKKTILADQIAPFADAAFGPGGSLGVWQAWGGALAYTLQIYFDFSGYCDMAVGLSQMFGIRLPYNFNSPYRAADIIDFWRRWHMTLSAFLRDYLYIPLGGNRLGAGRRYANLLLTMLLGGLWHGAGWTFIIWGLLHGMYLTLAHFWRSFATRLGWSGAGLFGRGAAWLATFLAVVVAWVFFRAPDVATAGRVLHGMAGLDGVGTRPGLTQAGLTVVECLVAWTLPNSQEIVHGTATGRLRWVPSTGWAILAAGFSLASIFAMNQPSHFLYFNF